MAEAPTNLFKEPAPPSKEQSATIYRIPRIIVAENAAHLQPKAEELNRTLRRFSLLALWINHYHQNPFIKETLANEQSMASDSNLQKIEQLIQDRPKIYTSITALYESHSHIPHYGDGFRNRPGGDNESIRFTNEIETVESEEDLNKLKRNLDIIIHDLRNPFTSLSPRLQIFEMKKPTPELIQEYSQQHIAPQLERMFKMLSSLPERLRNEYAPETLTIDILNNLVNEQLVKPLEPKPFGLEIAPLSATADKEHLRFTCNTLFLNELLGNNLQNYVRTGETATEPKRIRITLEVNPEEKTLSLVLTDTLGGFKPGVLDKDGKFTGVSGHGGTGKAMKYYQDLIGLLFDRAKLEARDVYTLHPDNPEKSQKGAEIKITMPLAA